MQEHGACAHFFGSWDMRYTSCNNYADCNCYHTKEGGVKH